MADLLIPYYRGVVTRAVRGKTNLSQSIDLMWSNVSPEPNSGCWLWCGKVFKNGYGSVKVNGKEKGAHIVAYELVNGAIIRGLEIDHLCRVRCCINPSHLEPVTREENTRRGNVYRGMEWFNIAGANRAARTHCRNGHLYSEKNTRPRTNGIYRWRKCKACQAAIARQRYWSDNGREKQIAYRQSRRAALDADLTEPPATTTPLLDF